MEATKCRLGTDESESELHRDVLTSSSNAGYFVKVQTHPKKLVIERKCDEKCMQVLGMHGNCSDKESRIVYEEWMDT